MILALRERMLNSRKPRESLDAAALYQRRAQALLETVKKQLEPAETSTPEGRDPESRSS